MKTIPCATTITLTTEERAVLEALTRSTKSEVRMRTRARIVLLAVTARRRVRSDGLWVARREPPRKWRVRYARARFAGLDETGKPRCRNQIWLGRAKAHHRHARSIPASGYSNWTAPLLARALGDIHEQYVWRFLRAQKIDLSGRKSWCESSDPEFVAKAAEIVGLYMAPPTNAVVLSVDEKPSIQALERAQDISSCPPGVQ